MSRRPRRIGPVRRLGGVGLLRAVGWGHGVKRRSDPPGHLLDTLKQQAEFGARAWAAWWGELDGELKGNYCALVGRLDTIGRDQQRLTSEVQAAKTKYETDRSVESELALRKLERDLDRLRRQETEVRANIEQARGSRLGKFQFAKNSAQREIDYREAQMRAYCAANRHAPSLDQLPKIEFPKILDVEELDWKCGSDVGAHRRAR